MSLCLLCRRSSFAQRALLLSTRSTDSLIDTKTFRYLERLSLVDLRKKKGIARLQKAIEFADRLEAVDTSGVEPLVTVLEDESLFLRKDKVTEINSVRVVLASAQVTEEEYYVAPPGNIPLDGSALKEYE